jgi:hypothetical protein
MEVSGQLHAAALHPREKSPPYPLERKLGGPRSRSERREERKKILPYGDSVNVCRGVDVFRTKNILLNNTL